MEFECKYKEVGNRLLLAILWREVTFIREMRVNKVSSKSENFLIATFISRALGPALGGSIGLMFTMANIISVATYTIGFSESLLDLLADVIPTWDGM